MTSRLLVMALALGAVSGGAGAAEQAPGTAAAPAQVSAPAAATPASTAATAVATPRPDAEMLGLARTAMTDLHMIGDPDKAKGIVDTFVSRYVSMHKEREREVREAAPQLESILKPKMDEADDKAVEIFAEAFTPADLKATVGFLTSPAGKSYVTSIQPVMAKLRANTGTIVGPAVAAMQERLNALVGVKPVPGVLGELGRTEPAPTAPPQMGTTPATPRSATTPANQASPATPR